MFPVGFISIKEPKAFLGSLLAFVALSFASFILFSKSFTFPLTLFTVPAAPGAMLPKPKVLSKNLGYTIGLGLSTFLFNANKASVLNLK